MRTIFLTLYLLLFACCVSFAQETIQKYKGKTYIFDSYEEIFECDAVGQNKSSNSTKALRGSLFTIARVPDDKWLIIKFLNWSKKKRLQKREKYNFTVNQSTNEETEKFFLLEKSTFDKSCSEYTFEQSWDINFGTLTTPFKFRRDPFLFTTNLNLGTSVSFQRRFSKNWSWGVIGGLSLASVTLDSFSTNAVVTTSTDRPAVTPSFSGVLGYKNVNLTLGIGWDFINRISTVEKSWIYDGKSWIGIGLGISLFKSGAEPQTTPQAGQK